MAKLTLVLKTSAAGNKFSTWWCLFQFRADFA